jgi:hypothetical protein
MQFTIAERRYLVEKFIDQKNKEREEQEKELKKSRSK